MASLTCEPVGRRLHELLEQPQEPFLMEAYLVENGCSGRITRPHPSSPFCWPLNAAGKKLRKFGSHGGGIRRSRAASFLRRVLVELVYSKSLRKLLLLDNTTTNAKNSSSTIFDSLSLDSKDQLISPVSVLRLHHSDQTSLFDKQTNISHLPGFNGELPFRLETGYVAMDEESGAELFYYFVESERNPNEDPLLLWLNGGPGCSAFNGFALGIGPLIFKVDDFDDNLPITLVNPYAWTKLASMIFLDWPVGTGFSYYKNREDYFTDDEHAKKLIYEFLKKWLIDHPYFLSNTFYVGGDSYGGKMATLVAQEIVEGNEGGQQPQVNIKGYIVGNEITGCELDKNSQVPHAYGLGIISEELYKLIKKGCVGEDYIKPQNAVCAAHLKVFDDFLSEINLFDILHPTCSNESQNQEEIIGAGRSLKENYAKSLAHPSISDATCITFYLANCWANNHLVRKALQIKEGTLGRWYRCDSNVKTYHYSCNIPSSVPYHYNLNSKGYRTLVYSGDHDLGSSFMGTLKWIKSLGISVMDPWRSWHVNNQVAGYTVLFSNNLTFATVKGGSHVAPDKRPVQCLAMFGRWISHEVI